MTSLAIKRLMKDYKEHVQEDFSDFFSVGPVEKSIMTDTGLEKTLHLDEWSGFIIGPKDTPYEGYKFYINMHFSKDYPMKPPSLLFKTKIYHPNISEDGHVCLNILKNPPAGNWSPAMNATKILLSIHNLLAEPNPSDPLNKEAGNDLLYNKIKYVEKILNYCKSYAIKY